MAAPEMEREVIGGTTPTHMYYSRQTFSTFHPLTGRFPCSIPNSAYYILHSYRRENRDMPTFFGTGERIHAWHIIEIVRGRRVDSVRRLWAPMPRPMSNTVCPTPDTRRSCHPCLVSNCRIT